MPKYSHINNWHDNLNLQVFASIRHKIFQQRVKFAFALQTNVNRKAQARAAQVAAELDSSLLATSPCMKAAASGRHRPTSRVNHRLHPGHPRCSGARKWAGARRSPTVACESFPGMRKPVAPVAPGQGNFDSLIRYRKKIYRKQKSLLLDMVYLTTLSQAILSRLL